MGVSAASFSSKDSCAWSCIWLRLTGASCQSCKGNILLAFWLDTMSSGSSARYHLAAVPGLALLRPCWHAVNHWKQNWAHRHRRAGLSVPSWRGCGTFIVLYDSLIILLQSWVGYNSFVCTFGYCTRAVLARHKVRALSFSIWLTLNGIGYSVSFPSQLSN